jgi:hypothetical protein
MSTRAATPDPYAQWINGNDCYNRTNQKSGEIRSNMTMFCPSIMQLPSRCWMPRLCTPTFTRIGPLLAHTPRSSGLDVRQPALVNGWMHRRPKVKILGRQGHHVSSASRLSLSLSCRTSRYTRLSQFNSFDHCSTVNPLACRREECHRACIILHHTRAHCSFPFRVAPTRA